MTGFAQLVLGLLLAVAIASAAWRARALSPGGAVGAVAVGGMTFGFGGWLPALLLIFFFTSSSLLSRVGAARKRALAEQFAKGSRRDAGQVAANGALAAISAAIFGLTGSELWWAGMLGALAAVTADTWATELGVLARSTPRRLIDWQPAQPGASGAVTVEGTLAAVTGASAVGGVAAIGVGQPGLVLAAGAAGLAGSLLDSLLGAGVQARYWCPHCEKETERHPLHTCGNPTQFEGGWSWMDNDWVNFLCSSGGWVTAVLLLRGMG